MMEDGNAMKTRALHGGRVKMQNAVQDAVLCQLRVILRTTLKNYRIKENNLQWHSTGALKTSTNHGTIYANSAMTTKEQIVTAF